MFWDAAAKVSSELIKGSYATSRERLGEETA